MAKRKSDTPQKAAHGGSGVHTKQQGLEITRFRPYLTCTRDVIR